MRDRKCFSYDAEERREIVKDEEEKYGVEKCKEGRRGEKDEDGGYNWRGET